MCSASKGKDNHIAQVEKTHAYKRRRHVKFWSLSTITVHSSLSLFLSLYSSFSHAPILLALPRVNLQKSPNALAHAAAALGPDGAARAVRQEVLTKKKKNKKVSRQEVCSASKKG